jgi:hypothetical protein
MLNPERCPIRRFQGSNKPGADPPRRPDCRHLLDVFKNIRDDENEHVKTMAVCRTGGMHSGGVDVCPVVVKPDPEL